MIGIYCVEHVESGKRYIGKSKNILTRLKAHAYFTTQPTRSKDCNLHFYNAVQKYGWEAFVCRVIEKFDTLDEDLLKNRELHWMDHFKTCDRNFGYNLRRDSSTKMEVSDETRLRMSEVSKGELNPNYGNNWNDEQKKAMSAIQIDRHKNTDKYGDEWKRKIGEKSTEMWKDDEKRLAMAAKVSVAKEKYDFYQYKGDELIAWWSSVKDIVELNPGYKWQNIYAVCNGYKPTYMGFVWEKRLKSFT